MCIFNQSYRGNLWTDSQSGLRLRAEVASATPNNPLQPVLSTLCAARHCVIPATPRQATHAAAQAKTAQWCETQRLLVQCIHKSVLRSWERADSAGKIQNKSRQENIEEVFCSRGVWCSERNWKFSSTNGLCSIYHLEGAWPLMPLMKCLCQKRNSSYHFAESTHSSSPFSFYCYCVLKSFTDQAFIKLRVPRLILNAVKIRVESASLVRLSGL